MQLLHQRAPLLMLLLAPVVGGDTLYQIDGEQCGESDVAHAFVRFAIAASPGLQQGSCDEQGFTVAAGTTSQSTPLGDIDTRLFTRAGLAGEGAGAMCSESMLLAISSACANHPSITV